MVVAPCGGLNDRPIASFVGDQSKSISVKCIHKASPIGESTSCIIANNCIGHLFEFIVFALDFRLFDDVFFVSRSGGLGFLFYLFDLDLPAEVFLVG